MENILNIINFIRGAEPRDRSIDLVEPVRQQIALMKRYDLPGTFLLQYDAMLREDILELLRPLDASRFELGVWFEMNQPHVEAAGLTWRGRPGYEWDWHANVGFSVGYSLPERRALADALVEKFASCFGYKPKSVGSWMLDAYTLDYLAREHGIIASCNCKDQWGTDGYTIWGGYWNQGYYPSRHNVLCPAQTAECQIPVPVFRMLGSDPVTQYDLGLKVDDGAAAIQNVASLEPVYGNVGGDPEWVNWFMRQNFQSGGVGFGYAQAGQENSFGWPAMEQGLRYQLPLFAKWRAEKGLRVERLEDTGRWYRARYPLTPATAVCAMEPYGERQAQSVWYDCRNYRVNLYRDAQGLRLRDMTLFDERYAERYMDSVCETEYLVYDNLFLMDGNRMSGRGILAGAWVTDAAGRVIDAAPLTAAASGDGGLRVDFPGGGFELCEDGLTLWGGAALSFRWNAARSPFKRVDGNRLLYEHNGTPYALRVDQGCIQMADTPLLLPEDGRLALSFERGAAMTR
ncbi:MAG: hypothetical protein IJ048_13365 [Clostridia bacterium]|nr:hypothetical protein [Clostridia bacterium]